MSPDDFRQDIELKVVDMLKGKLESGLITQERAQAVSQHVLDLLRPGMTFEELYKAIPRLDDTMPELAPIVLPLVRQYEEDITQKTQESVRNLIRQGQFDAAAKLAQQAIDQDLKLVWTGSGKPTENQNPL